MISSGSIDHQHLHGCN
jgi:hypothetical protein